MIVEVPRWTNAKMEVIKKNTLIIQVFMKVVTMQWRPIVRVESVWITLYT